MHDYRNDLDSRQNVPCERSLEITISGCGAVWYAVVQIPIERRHLDQSVLAFGSVQHGLRHMRAARSQTRSEEWELDK